MAPSFGAVCWIAAKVAPCLGFPKPTGYVQCSSVSVTVVCRRFYFYFQLVWVVCWIAAGSL